MTASQLVASLRTAGLTVRPAPSWETRTVPSPPFDRTATVGICNHWDAISIIRNDAYYISGNKFGGLIYNIVINRDGLVRLLGQRLTWNAGKGSSLVLNALRLGRTPPRPGPDDTSGNPWLFGVCANYHPDTDGAMNPLQYDALVRVNAVLVAHFNLSVDQVIDHRHWTTRKIDIRTIDMTVFRADVARVLAQGDDDMLKLIRRHWTRADIQRFRDHGLYIGEVDYWANDLGKWLNGEEAWDSFTSEVVAKGVSRGLVAPPPGPVPAPGLTEAQVKAIINQARVTV